MVTRVLNLIITGMPSILNVKNIRVGEELARVLNLIITGMPSIRTSFLLPIINWFSF